MLVLAFDSGAFRCGYSFILQQGEVRTLLDSGIVSLPRGKDEAYQVYRERLVHFWVENFNEMGDALAHHSRCHGDTAFKVVFETVPAIGFQSGGTVQSQLAQAVVTVCQTLCTEWSWPWEQISATTVKKRMTGYGDATKVQIRNAVLDLFPALEPRRKELTVHADESDAIAIGAVATGFRVKAQKGTNPNRRKKGKS